MLDMFGRRINEGDIITHVSRRGSSTCLHLARVTKTGDKFIKVWVLAGTESEWLYGVREWSGQVYKLNVFEGRETTYTATGNIMVSNGVDVIGIRDSLIEKQKQHIQDV